MVPGVKESIAVIPPKESAEIVIMELFDIWHRRMIREKLLNAGKDCVNRLQDVL